MSGKIIKFNDYIKNIALLKYEEKIKLLTDQNQELKEYIIKCLMFALYCKDDYTHGHSIRVAYYSKLIGEAIGLTKDEMHILKVSTLFHDIGKIGVPDSVLQKPTRLDENEFNIMKEHPEISAKILEDYNEFKDISKFAKHHHERFDGRGYPSGLKGEDIPLYSRIILIGDTFDAMTSTRPYRKGLPEQVAYDELEEFSGSQFDPYLTKKFIKAMQSDLLNGDNEFECDITGAKQFKIAA